MASSEPEPRSPDRSAPGLIAGRPFGIPVQVAPSWFLLAGVFIFLYAHSYAGMLSPVLRYVAAAVFVVLLYVSVLIHELGHSLTARRLGLPVHRIVLYPLGGFSEVEEAPRPGQELLLSAAGPVVSLILALIGWIAARFVPGGTMGRLLVDQLIWANLVVGLFNLLPGLPLDGGRMLRAVLWKLTGRQGTATIGAAWTGRLLALAMVLVPLVMMTRRSGDGGFGGNLIALAWLAMLAVFIWAGATQAIRAARFRERIPGLQARRMARKAIAVSAATPVAEAVRRAEEVSARAVVVVDHDDKPIAIMDEAAVMAVPPERRPWIEAGSLARTLRPGLVLDADLSGLELLRAMREARSSEYLLVEPSGQVYGVLAAKDVERAFSGV